MAIPLKIGTDLQAVTGPWPQNCPNESSILNNGMPQRTSMIKYGIRKAPANRKKHELAPSS